jgi:four helix bundle protein
MAFLFENLDVYKKSIDLADDVIEMTSNFSRAQYYLSDQLNRAVVSIPANIAEGNGRYSKADRQHFFRIARGSAFECVPFIEICRRKGLIENKQSEALKLRLEEICKMLSGLSK